MPQTPIIHPNVQGLLARYIGVSGGTTTRYYWIQVIYPDGVSDLASVTVTTPATLTVDNQVGVSWNAMPDAIGYNVYYSTSSTRPIGGSVVLALGSSENSFRDVGQSNAPLTGRVLSRGIKEAFALYDFSVDGGAVSTISIATADTIPAGAICFGGNYYVITACTSGGSGTLAFGVSGGTNTSILGATAVASLTLRATANVACTATPFRVSAAGQITATVATAALTAGVVEVHVLYYIPTSIA